MAHTGIAQRTDHSTEIVVGEEGVETAVDDEVAANDAVEWGCGVETGVIAVVASEFVERNYGRDDLHRGGGTHPLPMAVGVEGAVGSEIVDVQPQL